MPHLAVRHVLHPDKLEPEIPCLTDSVGKYRGTRLASVLDYVPIMVVGSEEGMVEMVSVNVPVIDNFLRNGALIRAAIQAEIVAKSVVVLRTVKRVGHDTY
jgi:hypothetical protein